MFLEVDKLELARFDGTFLYSIGFLVTFLFFVSTDFILIDLYVFGAADVFFFFTGVTNYCGFDKADMTFGLDLVAVIVFLLFIETFPVNEF